MTLSYHFRLCIFLFRNSYIQTATIRVRSERLSLPVCRRPGSAHGRTPGALPRFLASPDISAAICFASVPPTHPDTARGFVFICFARNAEPWKKSAHLLLPATDAAGIKQTGRIPPRNTSCLLSLLFLFPLGQRIGFPHRFLSLPGLAFPHALCYNAPACCTMHPSLCRSSLFVVPPLSPVCFCHFAVKYL